MTFCQSKIKHRLAWTHFSITLCTYYCVAVYRVAQKSKPLPNDQKIVLKSVNGIIFIVKLKYESSTIIFVGIRYSMRDLFSDLNNYA